MMIVTYNAVVTGRTVRSFGSSLDFTGRAIPVVVEWGLFVDLGSSLVEIFWTIDLLLVVV